MENKTPTIIIATGTRADWGLLHPLASELRSRGVEPTIAATHAHLYEDLGLTVREIESDGFNPIRIPTRRTAPQAMADAIEGFSALLHEKKPDMLVVLGDRFEILGAASAALLESVPIAHIAGGNVTLGAYDNAIRNSLTQMASLHLPETLNCARRIIDMGIPAENVVAAGSPGVYNALNIPLMPLAALEESLGAKLGDDFLLVTLHAATLDSVPAETRMSQMLEALALNLKANPDRRILITYPNSDSDPAPLIEKIERFRNEWPGRVVTIPSLGRVRYLSAAALCKAVVGNSSSAIEETPSLGHPTLDIGIRQKGRERGPGVFHCEADTDSIVKGLDTVLGEEAERIAARKENPYYIPSTPGLQADAILRFTKNQTKTQH